MFSYLRPNLTILFPSFLSCCYCFRRNIFSAILPLVICNISHFPSFQKKSLYYWSNFRYFHLLCSPLLTIFFLTFNSIFVFISDQAIILIMSQNLAYFIANRWLHLHLSPPPSFFYVGNFLLPAYSKKLSGTFFQALWINIQHISSIQTEDTLWWLYQHLFQPHHFIFWCLLYLSSSIFRKKRWYFFRSIVEKVDIQHVSSLKTQKQFVIL